MGIPEDIMRKNNIHLLQVTGDSLIGDFLLDGDQVIVEQCESVKDGELVVALTRDGRITLGRLHRDGHRVSLEPVDPSGEVRVFNDDDPAISGVVVGILRKYRG